MPTPAESGTTSNAEHSGINSIDALLQGMRWGSSENLVTTITYSFPDTTSRWARHYLGNAPCFEAKEGFQQLNDLQKEAVRIVLQSWSNIANLKFVEVNEASGQVGDVRFALSSRVDALGAAAYTYKLDDDSPASGDVWISPAYAQTLSAAEFNHMLQHEIGHALGLKHPFESNGWGVLPTTQDWLGNSVMSYRTTPVAPNDIASILPTTPMKFDIAAIQYLYGANKQFHSGNDIYIFLPGQSYFRTLWDAGGSDTFDYSSATSGSVIDLRPGHWSQLGNDISYSTAPANRDTVSIAEHTSIENAIGGSGNDTLIGNNSRNILQGGSGDDVLQGGKGGDLLDGGIGNDTMEGGAGNDLFLVDGPNDLVIETANEGKDSVSTSFASYTLADNLENLAFTGTGSFTGTGNGLANTIKGSDGDDNLDGGAGRDILIGAAGNDAYHIDNNGDRVIERADDGIDTVFTTLSSLKLPENVENLVSFGMVSRNFKGIGNALDNNIKGGSGNDQLNGLGGNDILDGDAGLDVLLGGKGDDILIYDPADLSAGGLCLNGGAGADTLKLSGAGVLFDFAQIEKGKITGIEKLDLSGSGNNQLRLNESTFADVTGRSGHALTIYGDTGDAVMIAASFWQDGGTVTDLSGSFHQYTNGAELLHVQASLDQFWI